MSLLIEFHNRPSNYKSLGPPLFPMVALPSALQELDIMGYGIGLQSW